MAVILILPARIARPVKTLANAIVAKSGFTKFHLVSLISAPSLLVILGLNLTAIERRVTERRNIIQASLDHRSLAQRAIRNDNFDKLTEMSPLY